MKRIFKLMAIILSVVLVVAGVVIAVTAADSTSTAEDSSKPTGFIYTDKASGAEVYSTDLQSVFDNVKGGTTIYLNNPDNDTYIYEMPDEYLHFGYYLKDGTEANHGNGDFTIDLCGNTVIFIQQDQTSYISLASYKTFTIKNGEIRTGIKAKEYTKDAVDYFDDTYTNVNVNNAEMSNDTTLHSVKFTSASYTESGSTTATAVTISSSNLTYTTGNLFNSTSNTTTVSFGPDDTNKQTYTVIEYDASAFPLFRLNWGQVKLVLESVDSVTGGLALLDGGQANGAQMKVLGGNHYVVTKPTTVTNYTTGEQYSYGAFIDTRSNILFVADGASFYIDKDCTLVSSASYAKTGHPDKTYDSSSTFTFKNCNVTADYINTNLVKYANDVTKINFNACKIYGSIAPVAMNADKEKTQNMKDSVDSEGNPSYVNDEVFSDCPASNILFNHGTMWASSGVAFVSGTEAGKLTTDGTLGEAIQVNGSADKVLAATGGKYSYSENYFSYTEVDLAVEATVTNYYGFKQVWTQQTSVTHTTEDSVAATLNVSYPKAYYQNNAEIVTPDNGAFSWSSVPTDNDIISGTSGEYDFTSAAKSYTFDQQIKIKDAFEIYDASGTFVQNITYDSTNPLSEAITAVEAGGTIKFISDYHWVTEAGDTYILIAKGMTIDINGHNFTVEQTPNSNGLAQGSFAVNTPDTVTITDSVGGGMVAVQHADLLQSYPLFRHTNKENTYHFVVNNITGYMGSMFYSYAGAGKVEIIGGTHYAVMSGSGSPGGYVCTRDDIEMTATGATFFMGGGNSSGRLLGTSAKGSSDNTTSKSKIVFTYEDCDIIASMVSLNGTGDADIFANFNEFTQVYFNNCRVYGQMDGFKLFDQDKTAGIGEVDKTSVRIGSGTVLVKDYYTQADAAFEGAVVPVRGIFVDAEETTKDYTFSLPIGDNYLYYGFQTTDYDLSFTFNYTVDTKKVFEVLDTDGETSLGYIEETVDFGVSTEGKKTLNQAVKELFASYDTDGDNSTAYTLKFLGDYTVDYTNPDEFANYAGSVITAKGQVVDVQSSLNIDLNGYVFTVAQGVADGVISNAEQMTFALNKSGAVLTVSNGQINVYNDSTDKNATYAIFAPNVSGVGVVLNDLTVYAGSLMYSWGSEVDLTINGGSYNAIIKPQGQFGSAFIAIRNSANVNVTGASFYLAGNCTAECLFSSSAYNASMSANMKSDWTFTDCEIVADSKAGSTVLKELIHFSNGGTTWNFNGCTILASINPEAHANDVDNPVKDHSVVMGFNGTTATVWSTEERVYVVKDKVETSSVVATAAITESVIGTPVGYGISYGELPKQLVSVYQITSSGADGFTAKKSYSNVAFNRTLGEGVEVKWYSYESDEPIATTYVMIGQQAIPPSTTFVDVAKGENNWYTVAYTDGAWTTTKFGSASDLTVTGEGVSFYPVVTVSAWLKAATYNLSLLGNVSANLLLPTDTVPSEVSGIVVKDSAGATLSGIATSVASGKVDITYTNYDMYEVGSVDAVALSGSIKATVTFTVSLGSSSTTATQTITISPLNYARAILSDTTGTYDEAKAMIANMLRYSDTLMTYAGTSDAVVTELYNQYSSLCTELAPESFAAEGGDYTALTDGVESISYVVDNYQLKLKLVLKSGYSVSSITIDGWVSGSTDYNWDSGIEYEFTTEGQTVLTANISIYNVDKLVTVTLSDGSVGTYSMNDYYSALDGMVIDGLITDAQCESLKTFLEATRAYGESAASYRFGPKTEKQA